MQCFLLIGTVALLQSYSIVSAAPLLFTTPEQSVRILRRVPYSVVAVDGGDTATTTALTSPTQTVTLTSSATKTIDTTRTIIASTTVAAATTPNAVHTVYTVTEPPLTTTIASTVTQSQPPVTKTVVAESQSQQPVRTNCETFTTVTSLISTTIAPLISSNVETRIVTQTSLFYGAPPMPTTYDTGSSARYTASQAWNVTTTTSPYASTATMSTTGQMSPTMWTPVP